MAEETADLPAAPQGAVSSWATVAGALRQDVLRKFGNPTMLLFVTSLLPKFTSAVPALAAVDLGLCTPTLLSLTGRVRRLAVEQR